MKTNIKIESIKHISIALIISMLISFIILLFCNPVYMVNDDAMMEMIASGTVSGTPNPYLVLSSTLIGSLLTKLYNYYPSTNWYALYLYLAYTTVFAALYYLALSKSTRLNAAIKTILLLSINIYVGLRPQFTVVSILLVICTFLFLMRFNSERRISYLFVALFFLIAANLIRFESIYIFIILFLPLLVIQSIKSKNYAIIITPCIVMLATFTITLRDHNNLSKQMGHDVFSFIRATETIIDNPNTINNDDLEKIEWSKVDLFLMKIYFFIDESKYTSDKVHALADGKKGVRSMTEVGYILYELVSNSIFIITLLVILVFLTISGIFGKTTKEPAKLLLLFTIGLLLFLVIRVRLPIHLFIPLLLCPIIFIIYSLEFKFTKTIILSLVIIFISIFNDMSKMKAENIYIKSTLKINLDFMHKHPQFLFHNFNIHYARGFFGIKNKMYLKPKNLLFFGWIIGTPVYESHIKYHNLKSGHLKALWTDDDIRLITQTDIFTQLLEQQIRERFDPGFKLIICDSVGESKVYKRRN